MACNTCSGTMQHLPCKEPLFWCPRCGTLRCGDNAVYAPDEVPLLVPRVRQLLELKFADGGLSADGLEQARIIGVIESCTLENQRTNT